MFHRVLIAFAILIAALWAFNTSTFAPAPERGRPRVLAHRGQHQTFDATGLGNDGCSATRIDAPTHAYLENTIASMRAAFDAGAEIVELDVHLTPDREFAVFHDWTLDCRTNGTGVTEKVPMSVLRTLDIGHGYTADGGKTFPFRGKGIGLMPTLTEVLDAFPEGRFLVNFKSRRKEEGEELARLLNSHPDYRARVYGVYGGNEPTEAAAAATGLPYYSRRSAVSCLTRYLALGWSGYVPEDCRGAIVPVPKNYAFLLWGWPNRFMSRMSDAGSDVVLIGDYESGDPGTTGIDQVDDWRDVPKGFAGLVWTNRIEKAGELARQSGYCEGRAAGPPCAP